MEGFILGFGALADMLGKAIVGTPKEDETHNPENGDGLQATTKGLMVWRKGDNHTAFTDGYRTWINGPYGLQMRLNSELFDWEKHQVAMTAEYRPTILGAKTISAVYPFLRTPKGVALHGTRSDVRRPLDVEFPRAAAYGANRTDGLSANCTVGEDSVAVHMPWDRWGWHAYQASMYYISLEIAQAKPEDSVTDGEVRSAAWCIQQARKRWPDMPLHLPTHAELEASGETVLVSGKTDVFPYRDPRADELRARIFARLEEVSHA